VNPRPFRRFEGLPPEVEAVVEAAKAWCVDENLVPHAVVAAVEALREPTVTRYTVELRAPYFGERFLSLETILVAGTDTPVMVRPVIVGEVAS